MYKWEDQIIPESKIHLVLNDKNFIEKDWKKYISYKIKNERKETQNRIWMRIPLKDISKQYSEYLFIPNIIEIFEVYLDDRKIYSTRDESVSNATGEKFYGLEWHLIKLPDISSNKFIYIRNYSSNSNYIGIQYDVKIGLKDSISYWILSRNISEILMGVFSIILFPLFLLVLYIFKPINKFDFLIYSLLSLFLGIFFINQTDSVQFVFHQPMVRAVMWELLLVSIPIISILLYINLFERNKILIFYIYIFVIYLVGKYIFVGLSFFNKWTDSLIILVMIVYFTMGILIIKKVIKKDIDSILLFAGFILLAVPVLAELWNYDFKYIRMVRIKHPIFAINIICGFICLKRSIIFQNEKIKKEFEDMRDGKIQAEIEYLEFKNKISRVIPHYLYNTLSYILNNKSNKSTIEKSVKYLTNQYRNLVKISDSNNITKIELELNHTKEFLDFQKKRFIKDFTFSIQKNSDLDENRLIPLLSIHSLVDNSYKHGIRHSMRKGKIKIYLENYFDGCRIIVEDNGIGLKDNFIKSKTLLNIEMNAKFIYNEVYTKIESIVKNKRKIGTRVELIFYSRNSNYFNQITAL